MSVFSRHDVAMRTTRLHYDAAAVADGDGAFGQRALLIQRFRVRGLRFGGI